ncbi:hypothetical protein GPECTOR_11g163 [Gonium pectorale]|uniref:GATA-type domain-containing protein n=1 Tax=Gonium pectorale TaxID=33097 RepID=A0A150GPJ3_GONPE|nr:hypothetical protein GPECTOR_11g163 [Gonium pectorale]|eukprot:KXZ51715.1 hypothetical protein GPECTOR_11g163 [Gonium pectorale]
MGSFVPRAILPLDIHHQLRQQQLQDALLLARPAVAFSEHPCTLLRARTSSGDAAATGTKVACAELSAADGGAQDSAVHPQPKASACCADGSADDPCEASSAAAVAPAEAVCAQAGAVPAPSSGGEDVSMVCNSHVQAAIQEAAEPEVASPAAAPPSAVSVGSGDAWEAQPMDVHVPVPAQRMQELTASAAVPVVGRQALAVPPPAAVAARSHKRRAAAAAAAAVVKVAAREDDEDDEDYEEEDDGSAGSRASKRVKRGGPVRQTAGKLVRGGVTCRNCGATQTPQWRCGPEGPRTLCNACGVRFKKGLPLAYMERKKRQMGL